MTFPYTLLIGIAIAIPMVSSAADDALLTLIAPATPVAVGATIRVDLVGLNAGSEEVDFHAPATLPAKLLTPSSVSEHAVELRGTSVAPALIAPHGFAARSYELTLPGDVVGDVVLDVVLRGGRVRASFSIESDASPSTAVSALDETSPALSAFSRVIAGRLAPHEPTYFVYGPDAPEAKFQISLKYRLLTLGRTTSSRRRPTLQAAYTQRSLWTTSVPSNPFYDSSYMPEVFVESLDPIRPRNSPFLPIGWKVGYRHESNGRDGDASRSYEVAYASSMFAVGSPDAWFVGFAPEVWAYVGSHDKTPDVEEYRGNGQLRMVLGYGSGPALVWSARANKRLGNQTHQLDLSVPLPIRAIDFRTYVLAQYFHGYGESLLSYDQTSNTVRVGIALIR